VRADRGAGRSGRSVVEGVVDRDAAAGHVLPGDVTQPAVRITAVRVAWSCRVAIESARHSYAAAWLVVNRATAGIAVARYRR
jgi:hypothetical protein